MFSRLREDEEGNGAQNMKRIQHTGAGSEMQKPSAMTRVGPVATTGSPQWMAISVLQPQGIECCQQYELD